MIGTIPRFGKTPKSMAYLGYWFASWGSKVIGRRSGATILRVAGTLL